MFLTAGLLFIVGFFCLVGTIITLIFTIISFANSKESKFIWLTSFLILLLGLVFTIITIVRKTVNKIEHFAEEATETFQNFTDSLTEQLSDSSNVGQYQPLANNEQIKLLKNYSLKNQEENVPEEFYTYLGFGNYYRYPLTYPYSIHCNLFKDDGELFSEKQVTRFDENDNGEVTLNIENIKKIAFDANWLLIEYEANLRESDKKETRYILIPFHKSLRYDYKTEKELFKNASEKGYKGNRKLMTIEEYDALFNASGS